MNERRKRFAKHLQKFVHLLTAFTIFMKALTKLEHPHGYWPLIVFLCAAGMYIVTITILHGRLHHHALALDISVLAIECVVTAIMGLLYAREGAHGLPYVMGLASAGFLVAIVVRVIRKRP